jgi:ADP-ribose pyrophosphatase YjhB (NUDIX family)
LWSVAQNHLTYAFKYQAFYPSDVILIGDMSVSILKSFYGRKTLRFAELKQEMPSNKLAYHLKNLCADGLLRKGKEVYSLTTKGEAVLTRLNRFDSSEIRQPIQDVLLFPFKDGKYLFQRRRRRPFLGILGPIGAKRKMGEDVFETGARKLEEDSGLTGKFQFKGILEVKIFREDALFLQYVFSVFKITALSGKLKKRVPKGDNVWLSEKDFYRQQDIISGMEHHFDIVKSKSFMFVGLKQHMDKSGRFISSELVRKEKL